MGAKQIPIWSDGAPGSEPKNWPWEGYAETWGPERKTVKWVTQPTLTPFLPPRSKSTGVGIVVCPGGGYNVLEMEKEGYKPARLLQTHGIAAFVLKYRHYHRDAALQDAHRAIRYVRSRAAEWGIRRNAVGIGGFSAGGHVSIKTATVLHKREQWKKDRVDRISKRPDFLMLIYPALWLPRDAVVDASMPPTFMVNARDDRLTTADRCVRMYQRLLKLKVKAELHVYQQGEHGFGLGSDENACDSWPELFLRWLRINRVGRLRPGSR